MYPTYRVEQKESIEPSPKAGIKSIRSEPNFVQLPQARDYAQHLRELAAQWGEAADL